MKVLIIGDKPSALNFSPNVAFIGSRCYNRLLSWINFLGIKDYELINSHTEELQQYAKSFKGPIIILGKAALSRLIDELDQSVIYLPHPSFQNRMLNDKLYVQDLLIEAKERLYEIKFQ